MSHMSYHVTLEEFGEELCKYTLDKLFKSDKILKGFREVDIFNFSFYELFCKSKPIES